jgi:hypothetical protein
MPDTSRRSHRWKMATRGEISSTVGLGAFGASIITFRNVHVGAQWGYLWLRCGAGVGLSVDFTPPSLETLAAIFAEAQALEDATTPEWHTLECLVSFSSDDLNGAVCERASGDFSSPIAGAAASRLQLRNRYEAHNAAGRTTSFAMTRLATFESAGVESGGLSLGASATGVGGPLLRIWP